MTRVFIGQPARKKEAKGLKDQVVSGRSLGVSQSDLPNDWVAESGSQPCESLKLVRGDV